MGNLCSGNPSDGVERQAITRNRINVADFLSVCIYLSEECGKIIRQVEESGDLKTQEKGKDGPVTQADLRVQKTLEVCLNHIYPSLRIQGEESAASIANIQSAVDPRKIDDAVRHLITTQQLNDKHSERREWIRNTLS